MCHRKFEDHNYTEGFIERANLTDSLLWTP